MELSAEGNKQDAITSRLDAWLTRATHGLCPRAKERVRREIAAHHAEAVEHLRDTGLSLDAADAQALEGLGDATIANKALRRTYLTKWQQRLLASLSEPVKPLKTTEYSDIVFYAGVAPYVALSTVFFHFQSLPLAWHYITLLYIPFIFSWIANRKTIRSLRNRLRKRSGRECLSEETATTSQVYPWFLIACFLSLYAAWRCYYWDTTLVSGICVDFSLIGCGGTLYARMQRRIGAYCFSPSRQPARKTTGTAVSYIALLWSACAACLLWSPSLSLISWLLSPFLGLNLEPTYYRSPEEGVDASLYGMVGIVLALVFCKVAIRWMIGLYLLRKAANGDGAAEPGPVPYLETPLGE